VSQFLFLSGGRGDVFDPLKLQTGAGGLNGDFGNFIEHQVLTAL
jgi:hypothetical protein